jgi:DivIVA domain-containing protein
MRCRECAAEVEAAARVCSRCGAPIVGQRPVAADTVAADIVVRANSDTAVSEAAGKAVAAGVAEQALPEPDVPGSGARVPAELRLVLAGYVGDACAWFAVALAGASAFAGLIFFGDDFDRYTEMVLGDGALHWLLYNVAILAFVSGSLWGLLVGSVIGVQTLQTRLRFSRLLRRPSYPRTATVTASKRGGRTLILDIIPRDGTGRGYQSLSEVPLALRTKAGMLVPGETVNVYGGSGGKSELLISSPGWGRAFLGTVESRSALQPRLLDEKVSGVTLVDWAAWAASTTFRVTGEEFGYDKREVDAFRSAVRDTFLGVIEPGMRSDGVGGKQFSTAERGYDKTEVDAFVEAAGLRLAAMESTDRPAGLLVSGAILFGWAEWADSAAFSPGGYKAVEVDAFQEAIRDTFLGVRKSPVRSDDIRVLGASEPLVRSDEVRGKQFSSAKDFPGYKKKQVAAFLDAAGIRLAAMESTDRPPGPVVSGALLAEWAEWADSTRFSTTPRLWVGYATAEVHAFRAELRDTFLAASLGVRKPPLTWDDVQRKWPGSGYHQWFSTTRGWSRPGYDIQEVDAFVKMAKLRLIAMRPTDNGRRD